MSGSNRGIIVALGLIALVSWSLFAGWIYGASLNPKEYRYQPYRYAADKPFEVDPTGAGEADAQALGNRTPCDQPKGQSESDLCAQWRAANAAEDSAFWTKWGVWIAIVGSSLLLWQIILTRQAVEDTSEATEAMREANEIAERNARKGLRPYIWPEAAWFKVTDEGEPVAQIVFKNFGQTPALNKQGWTHTWVECFPLHDALPEAPEDMMMGSSVIGPGATSESTQPHGLPLNDCSRAEIEAGRAALYVYGAGTYISLFGKKHMYRFIYFASGPGAIERGRLQPYMSGNIIDPE